MKQINYPLPENVQRFKAVFVLDLTAELSLIENFLADQGIEEEQYDGLLLWTLREMMSSWGFAYLTKPLASVDTDASILFKLTRWIHDPYTTGFELLYGIIQHAPSVEIDDLWLCEGSLFIGYEDEKWKQ